MSVGAWQGEIRARQTSEPLAEAFAGSQGLESADHFLNHQKRSSNDKASTNDPYSMSIPPFPRLEL
jgi:hypothetical protein